MDYDEIGEWSERKLEILQKYVTAFNTVLAAQPHQFHRIYIDGFAGAGEHVSKRSGERIPGSPLRALDAGAGFHEYHFVDMDPLKTGYLRELIGDHPDVYIHEGDCNRVLLDEVFARIEWRKYHRAFCCLDPYGLHLSWAVVKGAAATKAIEVMVNFPTMDINMNCGLRAPDAVRPDQAARMTVFWGDESWRDVVYTEAPTQLTLFGGREKAPNDAIAEAYSQRLRDVAGFRYVAEPIAMRNSRGATLYYLIFASPNETGASIANQIFRGYR